MSKSRNNGSENPTPESMLPESANASEIATSTDATTERKRGKSPMTPEQKEARKAFLSQEPHDAKFRRLAVPRFKRARSVIKQIGVLANKSQYTWDVGRVTSAIDDLIDRLRMCKQRFAGVKDSEESVNL